MKKLFSKILSTSIMFVCLSFVSFVKADRPDWLAPGRREYKFFFELSDEAQAKLIGLHKRIIGMNGNKYDRSKRELFFDTLKLINSLAANPSKETDPQILPIVTGYLKKDNNVYINLSVLTKLTGCCRSSINGYFQGLHYRSVNSLGGDTHHGNIQSLNLPGGLCDDFDYTRKWGIKVPIPPNTGKTVPEITPLLVELAQEVINQELSSGLGNLTFSTVESSNDQPQIPTRMPFVPINTAAVENKTSVDFASLYVYPELLLNNHTNTDNSFD